MSGKTLDHELVAFCSKATKKQQKFLTSFVANHELLHRKQTIPFDEPPVFVTVQERVEHEHISNKPVAKVQSEISNQIALIHSVDMQAEVDAEFQQMKKRKALKHEFVTLHGLVTEYVELQVTIDDGPEDEVIVSEISEMWRTL